MQGEKMFQSACQSQSALSPILLDFGQIYSGCTLCSSQRWGHGSPGQSESLLGFKVTVVGKALWVGYWKWGGTPDGTGRESGQSMKAPLVWTCAFCPWFSETEGLSSFGEVTAWLYFLGSHQETGKTFLLRPCKKPQRTSIYALNWQQLWLLASKWQRIFSVTQMPSQMCQFIHKKSQGYGTQ